LSVVSNRPIVDLIAGARPNFIKLAPVKRALDAAGRVQSRIIHTGQHYNVNMNDIFFSELEIPPPDAHLNVGSGPHGAQTARILERYEASLMASRPRATVVFGDVNSTVACTLAAVKLGVPVVHVEAGLRSFDRSMPEEINRILTDAVTDLLLVSESSGVKNLEREGVIGNKVVLVGNVMIDTLLKLLPTARGFQAARQYKLDADSYGLVTMHRPSNVDQPETLRRLLELLHELSQRLPLVFPVHPRTAAAAERFGLGELLAGTESLYCVDPVSYLTNLSLMSDARLVLTDSGGIQEETSVLGLPCLTIRESTERPITVELGTSRLVGNDTTQIRVAFEDAVAGRWRTGSKIPLWDGHTGERIATELERWLLAGNHGGSASA
jgi:UDP-N-acetylglucosamine 2-epimerase (non-hydrolysing)